jgi:hypothetical protein
MEGKDVRVYYSARAYLPPGVQIQASELKQLA